MAEMKSENFTQVPNDLFEMIHEMSESELKVTLILIRETIGYHRFETKVSIAKLAKRAGISRSSAKKGTDLVEQRGTFHRINQDDFGSARFRLGMKPPEDYDRGDTPLQNLEGLNPPIIGGDDQKLEGLTGKPPQNLEGTGQNLEGFLPNLGGVYGLNKVLNKELNKDNGGGTPPSPSQSVELKPSNPEPLSPGQKEFLYAFHAKRFKTNIQRDVVLELEKKYGFDLLKKGIVWAATKGMNMGNAIYSLQSGLEKFKEDKPRTQNNGYQSSGEKFVLDGPSLICKDGMKIKKKAEYLHGQSGYSNALAEYKQHLSSCPICSSALSNQPTQSNPVQSQISGLAHKMGVNQK